MFCSQCGSKQIESARFCQQCGAKLPQGNVISSQVTGATAEVERTLDVPRGAELPDTFAAPGATAGSIYAGFWKRVAAYLLDVLLLMVVAFVMGIVAGLAAPDANEKAVETVINLLCIVGFWLYYALSESGSSMATIGKRALGIKVTDLDGHRLSFWRAAARYVAQAISGLLLGIGYLMPAWTKKKQALHDMAADCLVVNASALEAGAFAEFANAPARPLPTWKAWVIVGVPGTVFMVSLLAAIAIPQYQAYLERARAAGAASEAAPEAVAKSADASPEPSAPPPPATQAEPGVAITAALPATLAPGLTLAGTMHALYGSFDQERGGSFWKVEGATGDNSQFEGRSVFVRPFLSKTYTDGGRERVLLATHTQDIEDGKVVRVGEGCHACAVLIGLFVLERGEDGAWSLAAADRAAVTGGQWGAPPFKTTPMGTYVDPMLRIEDGGMNMGVSWGVVVDARLVDGHWDIKEISRSSSEAVK